MQNSRYVILAIVSLGQKAHQFLKVGNRIQVVWRLLSPVAAIQVGPNRDVAAVAGQLANIVDVVNHVGHGYVFVGGVAHNPAGLEHPGIKGGPNHPIPLKNSVELVITELTLMGH